MLMTSMCQHQPKDTAKAGTEHACMYAMPKADARALLELKHVTSTGYMWQSMQLFDVWAQLDAAQQLGSTRDAEGVPGLAAPGGGYGCLHPHHPGRAGRQTAGRATPVNAQGAVVSCMLHQGEPQGSAENPGNCACSSKIMLQHTSALDGPMRCMAGGENIPKSASKPTCLHLHNADP